MKLIADAGSTKTQWIAIDNGGVSFEFTAPGVNALMCSEKEMADMFGSSIAPLLKGIVPEKIWFYGAGCVSETVNAAVRGALTRATGCADVDVASDMLCAARALCGHQAGIACILGTGSNSCLFDGTGIVANTPPLGYILGDEGSGAVLGRTLVADLLKGCLPKELLDEFLETYKLTYTDIITRVYREPGANRFLAGFAPFISKNIHRPELAAMVTDAFRRFIRRNLTHYDGWQTLPVCFTGSVAMHFREQLEEACSDCGINLHDITQAPASGIAKYHLFQNQ